LSASGSALVLGIRGLCGLGFLGNPRLWLRLRFRLRLLSISLLRLSLTLLLGRDLLDLVLGETL
jgi:hypothetical protein